MGQIPHQEYLQLRKDVMNVLIKYIGRILGFSVNVNDDEIGVNPSLAAPRISLLHLLVPI